MEDIYNLYKKVFGDKLISNLLWQYVRLEYYYDENKNEKYYKGDNYFGNRCKFFSFRTQDTTIEKLLSNELHILFERFKLIYDNFKNCFEKYNENVSVLNLVASSENYEIYSFLKSESSTTTYKLKEISKSELESEDREILFTNYLSSGGNAQIFQELYRYYIDKLYIDGAEDLIFAFVKWLLDTEQYENFEILVKEFEDIIFNYRKFFFKYAFTCLNNNFCLNLCRNCISYTPVNAHTIYPNLFNFDIYRKLF